MRNVSKFAIGLMLLAIVAGVSLPSASAQFYHARGIITAVYPQQIYLIFNTPGTYSATLIIVIKPTSYFVSDPTPFDSVTLTLTLLTAPRTTLPKGTNPPTLLTNVLHFSNVDASDSAVLFATVTFLVTTQTTPGYYFLQMRTQAVSAGAVFVGFDQVGVVARLLTGVKI
jgi:hypothetical protein